VPLIAIYIVFGVGMLPQRIPGLGPQAIIWALYCIVFALLYLAIRRSNTDTVAIFPLVRPRIGWKWMATFFALFSIASTLWNLTGLSVVVLVASWFPAVGISVASLVWSAREALRSPGTGARRPGPDSQS
jgi:hypothetical protein